MTRNIVLLCLDSVRKDFFTEYAPRLEDAADLTYEQCRAASCWSAPSHASMFTGVLPHRHEIHTYDPSFDSLERDDTFLGDLPDHRLLGVSSNVYASSNFGFDRLFDAFVDVAPHRRFPDGLDTEKFLKECDAQGVRRWVEFLRTAAASPHPGKSLANGGFVKLRQLASSLPVPLVFDGGAKANVRSVTRLVEDAPEPFFLFANLMDAHGPFTPNVHYDRSLYDAPRDWSSDDVDMWDVNNADALDEFATDLERLRGLYGAAIDYLDRVVVGLIDEIRDRTDSETTFVLTSDHGENLGFESDDGLIGHSSSLSEGLLHVPLAVVNPPEGSTGHVDSNCSHLDLGRLLVGLADGTVPDVARSRVPSEVVGISQTARTPENYEYWDRMIRSVVREREKVVWDSLGDCTSYTLDPSRPNRQEHDRECDEPPAWASSSFDEPIADFKARATGSRAGNIDAGTESRLRDLGYL